VNGESPVKINLFLKQLSIMRDRASEIRFIPADKVKEEHNKLTRLINKRIEEIKDSCNIAFNKAQD
jgi:pyruvate/oxaloacetate carboxyltransferase